MNRLRFSLFATLALVFATKGNAQQTQIALRLEYYQLDHVTANTLIATPGRSADASQIRKKLAALTRDGGASLVGSSYLVTRSGQRAKVESITELIYPVEFDPPEAPGELVGPISSNDTVLTPITPTAFETRNVGHTLEIDPVLRPDGVTIDINLAPERVTYLGDSSLGQAEATLEQPVFHTIKDSTAITVRDGSWALLGIHSPPPPAIGAEPPADQRLLCLLKTDLLIAGNRSTSLKTTLDDVRTWAESMARTRAANKTPKNEPEDTRELASLMAREAAAGFPRPFAAELAREAEALIGSILEADPADLPPPPPAPGVDVASDPFADPSDASANDPFADPAGPDSPPTQVAIHHLWYQLPAATATSLLDRHGGPYSDADPLLAELDRLVSKKRATLLDSAHVVTRSGQRATTGSFKEWTYPTEMDPPEVAQKLTGPIDPGAHIITHLSYTAFETRNVGTTFVADPVIGPDGLTVDLNLNPEIVRLATTRYIGHRESRVSQPAFYTIRDSTAVTLHSGTSVLVGMHTPMPEKLIGGDGGSGERILSIVSARIVTAD